MLADIDGEHAEQGAAAIREAGGTALGVATDVGDPAAVDALFELTTREFGPVAALVNNAAITSDVRHVLEGDQEWWDTYLRVNLTGQYLCLDRAARIMVRHGGGSIVNVSSGGGTKSHRGMLAYDVAKGGVEAMTRAAALELAPYGVRVNTLVPGLIATHPDEPDWSLQRARRDRAAGSRRPRRGPRRSRAVPGLRRRGLRHRHPGRRRRRRAGRPAQPPGRHLPGLRLPVSGLRSSPEAANAARTLRGQLGHHRGLLAGLPAPRRRACTPEREPVAGSGLGQPVDATVVATPTTG